MLLLQQHEQSCTLFLSCCSLFRRGCVRMCRCCCCLLEERAVVRCWLCVRSRITHSLKWLCVELWSVLLFQKAVSSFNLCGFNDTPPDKTSTGHNLRCPVSSLYAITCFTCQMSLVLSSGYLYEDFSAFLFYRSHEHKRSYKGQCNAML